MGKVLAVDQKTALTLVVESPIEQRYREEKERLAAQGGFLNLCGYVEVPQEAVPINLQEFFQVAGSHSDTRIFQDFVLPDILSVSESKGGRRTPFYFQARLTQPATLLDTLYRLPEGREIADIRDIAAFIRAQMLGGASPILADRIINTLAFAEGKENQIAALIIRCQRRNTRWCRLDGWRMNKKDDGKFEAGNQVLYPCQIIPEISD